MLYEKNSKLWFSSDSEIMCIEPWGKDSLRVRATALSEIPERANALLNEVEAISAEIVIDDNEAEITNGKIKAVVHRDGRLCISKSTGEILLDEYRRKYASVGFPYLSPLEIAAREFKPVLGGEYELTVRFNSTDRNEKIYGMGEYQQEVLNLKGTELELAQRNSQASVPFCVSSLGYGFLWNNPAIGRASFGTNVTTWYAARTDVMDYWITAGDTPRDILRNYATVTGTVPMMPDWAAGFWQSKLRYRSQDELLEVARKYKQNNLPISVIVADYFHWKHQGEWNFDERYWPDVEQMVKELEDMGIKLVVSVWPTVEEKSPYYGEMRAKRYLMTADRGVQATMTFKANTVHFDATNPEARKFVFSKIKQNYYDKGIKSFWLDEAEPELTVFDYDIYRYSTGPALKVGNSYPAEYSRMAYDGLKSCGEDRIINLVRCAWAGSQRYGALLWSGDIETTFECMRRQLAAGLNSGMAGIAWWTSDIGGFRQGTPGEKHFTELVIRWFQWATFCPVMRMHGWRMPNTKGCIDETGIVYEGTGSGNEVWSYGEEAYEIFKKFMTIRDKMHPYIMENMKCSHEKGDPIMRPVFYDFPDDKKCWENECETEFMFGDDLLVAPILYEGERERKVYLPDKVKWINAWDGQEYDGGQVIECDASLNTIPVFAVKGSSVVECFK